MSSVLRARYRHGDFALTTPRPSSFPDGRSVFGEPAARFPDRPARPTTLSSHGCATRMSLCRTLSPPGCPRDEFVFATTPSSQCPARSVRRVHALATRLPAPRVCTPRSPRPFARSKSWSCSPPHPPVATEHEFVVCTPRRSITRTSSRSASTAASHSYLCDGPPLRRFPDEAKLARCVPEPRVPIRRSRTCVRVPGIRAEPRLPAIRWPDPRRARSPSSFLRDERAASSRPRLPERTRSALARAVSCGTSGSRCDARFAKLPSRFRHRGRRALRTVYRTIRAPRA